MWKAQTTRLTWGLVAIFTAFWLGAGLLPAFGNRPLVPIETTIDGGVVTVLLHTTRTVLSPNTSTTLSIQVRDAHGQPVSGVPVNFTASVGVIDPAVATTDSNGSASVTYTANDIQEPAIITAEANGVTVTAFVEIRNLSQNEASANSITVVADAASQKPGGQTTLIVTILDPSGQPVKGETVTLFGSLGEVNPASSTTGADGKVTATFTAGNDSGQANIVALAGYSSGTTQLQVLGEPVATATPVLQHQRIYLPAVAR